MRGRIGERYYADYIDSRAGARIRFDSLCEKEQGVAGSVRAVLKSDAGDLRRYDFYCQKGRDIPGGAAVFLFFQGDPDADPVFFDHVKSAWVPDCDRQNSLSFFFD